MFAVPKFRFDEIAINSTEKKKPVETDRECYIGLEHLDSGCLKVKRWGSEVAPIGDKLIMHEGDVLFGRRRAYQKKVAIAPFDGIFSAHGMVLRPRENVICKEFFPFFISSDYFLDAAIKISVGSLSPTINWRDLAQLKFNIPSLAKQAVYARMLWAIHRLDLAYKTLLLQLDFLVQSQFMEMCEGETKRPIREICIRYGRGKAPNYVDHSNIYVVNQACIYWDGLHFDNVKYQNEELFKEENKLLNGAVLLNATGTGTLGRSCVFTKAEGVYMADGHVSIFYTDPTLMYPRFLQVFFSLPETQKHIYSECVNGSTNQIELSREKIGYLLIPTPSLAKQKDFMELVEQIDKSKLAIQQSLDALEKSKKSIMSSIFD